jgi:ComF family protein
MMYGWSQFVTTLIDTLFPRQCLGCAAFDSFLCDRCANAAWSPRYTPQQSLPNSQPLIHGVFTLGEYRHPLLREAMEHYKFYGNKQLADSFTAPLGRELTSLFHDVRLTDPFQPIICITVPLHRRRRRERGFDQTALLAEALIRNPQTQALAQQFLYHPNAVRRTKYTAHQSGLADSERQSNVSGVFQLSPQTVQETKQYPNPSFLIIDDIVTTGATVIEIAKTLRDEAPDASIFVAAILRGRSSS